MTQKIRKLFLTFFGSGLSPIAPGTIGTIAGMPFGLVILWYFGVNTLILAAILLTLIGIREIDKFEKETQTHDASFIVIDEVAGIWITMAFCANIEPFWLQLLLAFVTFRLFDIWKPSIIGRIDRGIKGGTGVMLDDIVAGCCAGIFSMFIIKGLELVKPYLNF